MRSEGLSVLLLEPFWGGSHRSSAEGWRAHSRHRVRIECLPARFWKWRMRGAAFEFARRLGPEADGVDVILATDLLDLAHLRSLLLRRVPAALYFHENQLEYPSRPGAELPERDLQYAFTNLASALAADTVAFNSAFQRDGFLEGLRRLLARMPDAKPLWAVDALRRRSRVLSLGVEFGDIPARGEAPGGPAVVLWNHRWEYDKDPDSFFRVLLRLADRGVDFRLIVAGECFAKAPPVFRAARERLAGRILHWGYAAARADYVRLLLAADVVVSTALQENFGISLVEAAYAGAHPLAPDRLSYPEVLPSEIHEACLYRGEEQLEERLEALLVGREPRLPASGLRRLLSPHAWEHRASAFDDFVDEIFASAAP